MLGKQVIRVFTTFGIVMETGRLVAGLRDGVWLRWNGWDWVNYGLWAVLIVLWLGLTRHHVTARSIPTALVVAAFPVLLLAWSGVIPANFWLAVNASLLLATFKPPKRPKWLRKRKLNPAIERVWG